MGTWEPVELAGKPDAAAALARLEAWWQGAILDRPTVQVLAPRPTRVPGPRKAHASLRDRWMDVEHIVACADAHLAGTWYGGEIFPAFNPNLGPEILTAAFGAELNFGESTSWSVPILHDWSGIDQLRLQPENPYVQCILELTRRGLEVGRGKFLTGFTDLHPGGDLAASLRDPQQLCIDLVTEPDQVKRLLDRLDNAFFDFYALQERLIREAGQKLTTCWLPLLGEGRYYVPSNDFSCMISAPMFNEIFVPELIRETEFLDYSIYHLDGPQALRHLDALLAMPKLGAIQYVYGAGNEPASRWLDVYRRIQDAGKNLHISIDAKELDLFMEQLRPEGVMLCMGVGSIEQGEDILKRVAKWTRRGR